MLSFLFLQQRLSAETSSSDHFIPSLSNLSPRQSGHSTSSGQSTTRPITSSYRVSDSRQHKTLADAMDAGLPIVDLNSSISSRSSSQHTTPNRITWAQLQQQRRAAADETDDSEVEKPVTRLSGSNGLGNRSQSVGSLSLKLMMMERQRREAESASRALKSNRRVSDHYGTTSRVWPTKGSDNEFNHHLVQLKQSLSDLQSQVPNLTPRKKQQHHQEHTVPTPVRVMAQPPAQQFQQPPMMMYPQPGQVMQPTYYGQQQQMIDPRYAAFQSTQSLIMPNQAQTLPYGSPSMQTISAFNTFSTPTHHHHLTNGMSTQSTIAMSPTQNGGNYFMPITSSGGSGENDSVSMTSTRKMLQDEDEISSQGINDVRRSQSMSAIQNRMRNSSSSLANHQQHNEDDDDALSEEHKDKQENVAFVVGVGDKGDADELEMKRKQKVFEMIMKRKKETLGKKDNRTLDEAKQRQAILEEQQEKEKRRQEHRERQQRKFEEYQQRKKEEEEQLELAKSGRSKTMGSTMTLPKSKSRDHIGQTNGTLGRNKNNQLVKVGEEETPPTTPRGGSATLRTTSRRSGPSSAPAPHSEVTGAELVPATTGWLRTIYFFYSHHYSLVEILYVNNNNNNSYAQQTLLNVHISVHPCI